MLQLRAAPSSTNASSMLNNQTYNIGLTGSSPCVISWQVLSEPKGRGLHAASLKPCFPKPVTTYTHLSWSASHTFNTRPACTALRNIIVFQSRACIASLLSHPSLPATWHDLRQDYLLNASRAGQQYPHLQKLKQATDVLQTKPMAQKGGVRGGNPGGTAWG